MLDIAIYRQNESLAKKEMDKWQIRSRHNLDLFEKAGFPVRVEDNQQLRALIDTMSENGFEYYQNSINGFSDEQLDSFLGACVKAIEFSEHLFPAEKPILPIHNLAQAFVVYTVINKLKKYDSVLEIGPGSGALAYFMSQKEDLKLYAQVEACESFYMLQSHLDKFLFKNSFYESVFLKPEFKAADFWTVSNPDSFQPPLELNIPKQDHKAAHYPWWRLGELANNDKQFDIVASNANLLEFSRAALLDYLPLIQKKLKDDGLFVFHCTGAPANGTVESLLKDLYGHRFAPLLYANEFVLDKKEDFETKKIVIAPAGYAANQLLDDDDFTSMFDEIVLLDDAKGGGELKGRKILSRDELAKTGIKEGVVFHDNPSVVKVFSELFHSIGIKTVDAKLKNIGRSFAVFVGEKHPLFEKYYDLKNFKRYFNSKEDCVANLFSFDCKERKLYSKLDISDFITKSCQK